MNRLGSILVALLVPVCTVPADDDVAAVRQAHAHAVAELRTAMAAAEAIEPGVDLAIRLPEFMDYNPHLVIEPLKPATITVKLRRRAGKWLPGIATGWTGGEHLADAAGLKWDQKRLTGTLRLRFDPRGERTQTILDRPLNYDQIPTQREPFELNVTLDLAPSATNQWTGTYRRTAQAEFPEVWNEAAAFVRTTPTELIPAVEGLAGWWRQLAGIEQMRATSAVWDEVAASLPDWRSVADEAAMAARAKAALQDAPPTVQMGPGGCDDPDFGPWWADTPIAAGTLTDRAGWQYVGRWQVVSGLPRKLDRRAVASSLLPVLVDGHTPVRDAAGKEYAWRTIEPPSGFAQQRAAFGNTLMRVLPPWVDPHPLPTPAQGGNDFLAVADVESATGGTVWLGTAIFAHGAGQRLYLNERLVWQTPVVDEPVNTRGAVMRVKLRRGTNRLLVHGTSSTFSRTTNPFMVALCTQDQPRAAATVAAEQARQQAAMAKAEQARRNLRGYQTDGRGQHPDADPVRAWDLDSGRNVLWRCRLPVIEADETANVLVIGKKVFVTGYPHVLTCLDADTGKVLWRRVSSPFAVLDPALEEQSERLRVAAERAHPISRDRLDDAQKAELDKTLASWQALLDKMGNSSANQGRKANWFNFPWYHTPCWAAPVSDGQHIWVKFGTGVAACYDLDGNRKWIVRTGNPIVGERCAPVLADGLLVLQLPRRLANHPGAVYTTMFVNAGTDALLPGDLRNYELVALDAATGAERWRTPVMAGGNEGSPVVMHAAKGSEVLPVIVTAYGTIVRAADGKVLADWSGMAPSGWQIPYWNGDRVYWTMLGSSVVAGRLVMDSRDRVALAPWWLSLNHGLTQMQQCGVYTVAAGDRLCVMNPRLGCSNELGPQEVATMDLETGATRGRRSFVFYDGGWTYMPHAAARDVVIFGQYKYAGTPPVEPYDNLAFCTQEDKPRVLVRNLIPLTKAGVVCDGDRVYVRANHEVICFARRDPAYERQRHAEHLLTETLRAAPRPPKETPFALAPEPGPLPAGVPTWPVSVSTTAPGRWLFVGPFAPDSAPLADPAQARLVPGQKLGSGEQTREVVALDSDLVNAEQKDAYYRGAMKYGEANGIEVLRAVGKVPSSLAYYYTVLRVSRACTVKFGTKGNGVAESWVAGQKIAAETNYRLAPGYYPWLVAVTVDRQQLPPTAEISLSLALWQVPEFERQWAAWRQQTEPFRAELLKISTDDPASELATKARALLQQLDRDREPRR